jgi:hypothetical protein
VEGDFWCSGAGRVCRATVAQIRLLARQVKAHSIDFKGGRWELRLIARPLYRYEVKNGDSALGGAVFAICQGTDPEIILSIQARKTKNGYGWHYAFVPFSDYRLHAQIGDRDVWDVPPCGKRLTTDPFWGGRVARTRLSAEDEAVEGSDKP